MGYRADETALSARRDNLRREVEEQREELASLEHEGARLVAEVRRKRWRIRLARGWRWVRRHPKLVAVLLLVGVLFGWSRVEAWRRARAQQARVDRVLGTRCATEVRVVSQPPARLFVSRAGLAEVELGKTPRDLRLCAAAYRLRLVHRAMIPWQREVVVRHQRRLEINASLVYWRPHLRPPDGVLVHSRPDGAMVFVDGAELGRTPLFVRGSQLPRRQAPPPRRGEAARERSMLLGVAAPGHRPVAVEARWGRKEVWVQLAPLGAGAGRRSGRRP